MNPPRRWRARWASRRCRKSCPRTWRWPCGSASRAAAIQVRRETKITARTIAWAFFPIPAVRCVHCYASDITERLNLEQQLRQSQKMQSVGQLAAGVAHDFNNVLTIIQGHCELVAMGEKLSKSGLDSLDQVRMAADRAAKLTQQLLTFGRKQFMQMELLDINEVIQQVTQMLRRVLGENVSLRSNLAPRLPAIEADATMMEQVIMNLSVNARDAMPGGGSLTIGTVPVMVSQRIRRAEPGGARGNIHLPFGERQRHGHRAGQAEQAVRAVLYDQGSGQGHGPGPGDRLWHRQAAPGLGRGRERAWQGLGLQGLSARHGRRPSRRATARWRRRTCAAARRRCCWSRTRPAC